MTKKLMTLSVFECLVLISLSGAIGLGWFALFILCAKTVRRIAGGPVKVESFIKPKEVERINPFSSLGDVWR